ncbi:hypothetical protein [Virgibacillus pantothenticus]|uniref:Uncharacterized protein n=1 Tax=Virgibacillus pantothenticus TaxID=1473 RepID=A0A0L0QSX5_VIRPA|nr:hypothetical protein [Virgibacillus pantothenticus]KNE21691.1 hypothetical protein AFK71_08655 [Virgibacillus pantothenticus]MEB5453751.1 hypothetical protein [Virgibacillus pantothenticus]MEB5457988.1 hypothetical protein [Virgibacillus pantothenticus]MEB5462171.1 hypothetical protein [Virgibacillus pantothenticus]MEB5466476.1 hypothetical protein [Virgibacillus pantothenticus]
MSTDIINIVAIVSTIIWIMVFRELIKSSKEDNRRKIITLLSAGSLSTLILTILLFQNIQF